MKISLALKCLIVAILPANFGVLSEAEPLQPQEIAAKALEATVTVTVYDENGKVCSIGSGFMISQESLLTNHHVIAGGKSATIRFAGQENEIPVSEVQSYDASTDLALLGIAMQKRPIRPLVLHSLHDSEIQVGDSVFAAGTPLGLEGTFSDGIISSIRKTDKGVVLQITCPISQGSSGGPVLDDYARVIGVAVASYADGQNLNLAIEVSHVQELLSRQRRAVKISDVESVSGDDSIVANIARIRPSETIEIGSLVWDLRSLADNPDEKNVTGSFSLRNLSSRGIQIWRFQVLVYDTDGKLVETKEIDLTPIAIYEKLLSSSVEDYAREIQKSVDIEVESESAGPVLRPANMKSRPNWRTEDYMLLHDFRIKTSDKLRRQVEEIWEKKDPAFTLEEARDQLKRYALDSKQIRRYDYQFDASAVHLNSGRFANRDFVQPRGRIEYRFLIVSPLP